MSVVRRMAVGVALVPAAVAVMIGAGAGTAAAATPYSGTGYVGISLDRNETRFLSDVNAGDVIDAVVPPELIGVYLGRGSVYDVDPEFVYATTDQLIDETAQRGGYVEFSVNDPAIWVSTFDIIQNW